MPKPKVSSFTLLKYESDGTPFYMKITQVNEYDGLVWNENVSLRKIEKLSLESQGFIKEFDSSLIIIREIYTSDMQKRQGFFVQKIRVAVPTDEEDLRLTYFKRVSSGKYCIVDFAQMGGMGVTERLAVNDLRFVSKVGKAHKITQEQARDLLMKKEAMALCEEIENPEDHKIEYKINV